MTRTCVSICCKDKHNYYTEYNLLKIIVLPVVHLDEIDNLSHKTLIISKIKNITLDGVLSAFKKFSYSNIIPTELLFVFKLHRSDIMIVYCPIRVL